MAGQPENQPQSLLTDDGELLEPLPVADAGSVPVEKPKPPENRLTAPRWQDPDSTKSILGLVGVILALVVPLVMIRMGIDPCPLVIGVFLVLVIFVRNKDDAARAGKDGVSRRHKKRSWVAIAQEKDMDSRSHR